MSSDRLHAACGGIQKILRSVGGDRGENYKLQSYSRQNFNELHINNAEGSN